MRIQKTTGIVESLESRTLLSTATLAGGVLRVAGTPGAQNLIVVANSPDGLAVNVTINSVRFPNPAQTFTRTFPKSLGIAMIRVFGGARADSISVGLDDPDAGIAALDLPVWVRAGAGDDLVNTAGGNDTVFAGFGDDTVNAGGGDNWVRGELGNDIIDTGGGNDRVNAGPGNDRVSTGNGDDLLRGELGDDVLEGEGGDDLLFGSFGDDHLDGGGGDDILWGGLGDDVLTGGRGNDSLGGIVGVNELEGGEGIDTFHVRDLTANPVNDFTLGEDVLDLVVARTEGPKPPAA